MLPGGPPPLSLPLVATMIREEVAEEEKGKRRERGGRREKREREEEDGEREGEENKVFFKRGERTVAVVVERGEREKRKSSEV